MSFFLNELDTTKSYFRGKNELKLEIHTKYINIYQDINDNGAKEDNIKSTISVIKYHDGHEPT